MNNAFGFALDSEDCSEVIDPWDTDDIDWSRETGADWIRVGLAASLGGKQVDGYDPTPTCEVLNKTTEGFAETHMHGRIKIDETVYAEVDAWGGDDRRFKKYVSSKFTGHKSSTKAAMLFDTGSWAESARVICKESAILASAIEDATGSRADACEIVSKITCNDFPEHALDTIELPFQFCKRDLISVHKPNHTIFTQSTIQNSILWHDQALETQKLPIAASVDWSKITVIARYIGEVNSRYDPDFVAYAKARGVPYSMVRGAWARVSVADYMYTPDDFASVPVNDTLRSLVPNIANAYEAHVDDCISAANRALANSGGSPDDVRLEGLLKLVEGIRATKRKDTRVRQILPGTDMIAPSITHSIDHELAARKVSENATSAIVLKECFVSFLKSDPHLYELCEAANAARRVGRSDDAAINSIAQKLVNINLFKAAEVELVKRVGSVGSKRMRKLLMTITSCSNPFIASPTRSVVRSMSRYCTGYIKAAVEGSVPKPLKLEVKQSAIAAGGSRALRAARMHVRDHLERFSSEWAIRYDRIAKSFVGRDDPEYRKNAVIYSMLAYAFSNINIDIVFHEREGYIDTADVSNSYLYNAAKNYARKRRLTIPKAPDIQCLGAWDLAEQLDKKFSPEYPFAEAEKEVRKRLEMFCNDLKAQIDPTWVAGDEEAKEPVVEEKSEPEGWWVKYTPAQLECLGGMDPSMMTEETAKLFMQLNAIDTAGPPKVTLEAVLASYPNLETAEEYASVNGYESFKAAFEELGDKCVYDTENPFCQKVLFRIKDPDNEGQYIDDFSI